MRFLLTICSILLIAGSAVSQDRKAKKILDKLSSRYTSLSSISIDFDLTIQYPDEEAFTYPSSVIQQGDKFVFTNDEHEYYGNGEEIWIYIADQNEVQINDFEEDESEDYFITPMDLLNQYKNDQFKYRMYNEQGNTKTIEFIPTDDFADYSKFRITVNEKKSEISYIEGFGKDGSKIDVDISKVVENQTYADSLFEFDKSKYPGVRVEDLRL